MEKTTPKPALTLHRKPLKGSSGLFIEHLDVNSEWLNIPMVESKYKATYIGEFALRSKEGGWASQPVSIFYQEEPHPEGSNYFGLFLSPLTGNVMITNGIAATEHIWTGLKVSEGRVIYSAYRHDFHKDPESELFIDGGPDYLHTNGTEFVSFKIDKDDLVLVKGDIDDNTQPALLDV